MKYPLLIILSSIIVCTSGCSNNEKITTSVKCIDVSEVKTSYSPPILFTASIACADKDEPMKAAQLFLFARIYGSYDISRVADRTSHQIIGIMVQNSFKTMGRNADSVQNEINSKLIKEPEIFKRFCNVVKKIGKPNYYPRYMINHKSWNGSSIRCNGERKKPRIKRKL